jgi:uncharacterized protein
LPHEASRSTRQISRCIGIDDGPFPPKTNDRPRYAPLIGVWVEGPHLQRLKTSWVTVDGLDGTQTALRLLKGSARIPVLLSGVTFGGFNLVNPWKVHQRTKAPTIVVIRSRPNNRAVKRALTRHFSDWSERWDLFRSLGALRKLRTLPGESPIFFEKFGCSTHESELLLKSWAFVSRLPEPLRLAGLVARGLYPPEPFG